MKIENVPLAPGLSRSTTAVPLNVFCAAVKTLEPGQSFVVGELKTFHRTALVIANHLLDGRFVTRKDKEGTRVGRLGDVLKGETK